MHHAYPYLEHPGTRLADWLLVRSTARKGCLVIANDLNPDAVLFAQRNAELTRVIGLDVLLYYVVF